MAEPVIHHRTDQFKAILAEVSERLKRVFRTRHPVLTVTGSGTTAFEAAQISLVTPGDRAITCASGKFGERWQDVYARYGVEQVGIEVPWGNAVTADRIEQALKDCPDARVVVVVHSETSTATACELEAIAAVVSRSDALLIVDGITSVGALPVEMDAWGVDVVVSGSQKALMLPPGLGYVGLGPRAVRRLQETDGGHSYSLDLRRWLASYEKNDVPFTPPVSLIRGQRVALDMIEREGLDRVWSRTARLAAATRAAVAALGLKVISHAPSDSLTGVFYPEVDGHVIDDKAFRGVLRDRHGIHIAGGQNGRLGSFSGRIFRISHMGHVNEDDTLAALAAIEKELAELGYGVAPRSAVEAAEQSLADASAGAGHDTPQ